MTKPRKPRKPDATKKLNTLYQALAAISPKAFHFDGLTPEQMDAALDALIDALDASFSQAPELGSIPVLLGQVIFNWKHPEKCIKKLYQLIQQIPGKTKTNDARAIAKDLCDRAERILNEAEILS